MKFTKSIFGKEWEEVAKFNKLDLDERSIVFYSESSVFLYPYAEQIINELEKNSIELRLKKEQMNEDTYYIKFKVDNPISPLELFESPDARKLGLLVESIEISTY